MKWLIAETVRPPRILLCLSESEYQNAVSYCSIRNAGGWLDEGEQVACVHTWESEGMLTCVVCLCPGALDSDPVDVILTLVHEAVHVFQRLCDSIGETAPSREFEAYSIERISGALVREFQRRYEGGEA